LFNFFQPSENTHVTITRCICELFYVTGLQRMF
jgi:hypothetical protein